jgi:hypothetical protein
MSDPAQVTSLPNVSNDAILTFCVAYERQQNVVNRERMELARLVKGAKKDGLPTGAILEACKKRKAMDPDELKLHMRDVIRTLGLRNLPMKQADIFDGWTLTASDGAREEDADWRAEQYGHEQGFAGAADDANPFAPGTSLYVQWEVGRRAGLGLRERFKGDGATGATARKQRPSRGAQTRLPGTEVKQDSPALAEKKAARMAAAPKLTPGKPSPKKVQAKKKSASKKWAGKRPRGRPPGSKNRPKLVVSNPQPDPPPAAA